MKRWATIFMICAFALAATGVMAAGDAAKGEAAAKGCTCHKKRGDLDGMEPAAFTQKMLGFQSGAGNKGMVTIAKKLSAQDIEDLGAYFAGLPKK